MVEWFLWAAPYFSYRYPIDKRNFYRKLEKLESKTNAATKAVVVVQPTIQKSTSGGNASGGGEGGVAMTELSRNKTHSSRIGTK